MFRLTMVSLIFILVLSSTFLAGFSGAWFTDAENLHNTFTVKIPDAGSVFSQPEIGIGFQKSYFYYPLGTYNDSSNSLEVPLARPNFWPDAESDKRAGTIRVYDNINTSNGNGKIFVSISTVPTSEYPGGYMLGEFKYELNVKANNNPGKWKGITNFNNVQTNNYAFTVEVNNFIPTVDGESFNNVVIAIDQNSNGDYFTYMVVHSPETVIFE